MIVFDSSKPDIAMENVKSWKLAVDESNQTPEEAPIFVIIGNKSDESSNHVELVEQELSDVIKFCNTDQLALYVQFNFFKIYKFFGECKGK